MLLAETVAHLFHPRRSNNHRPRLLHPEAMVVLSLLLVAFVTSLSAARHWSPPLGQVLGFASSITPTQVIELTNQQRTAVGLPPLTLNAQLTQAAQAKAQHMFLEQYWAHTAPDGTQPWKFFKDAGYNYKVAGENLARDFSNSSDMVNAWMASPTHKANIVSNRYQEIGIAVVDGTLDGYETTLVVQMFGVQSTAVAAVDAPAKAPAAAQVPVASNQPTPLATPVAPLVVEPATELQPITIEPQPVVVTKPVIQTVTRTSPSPAVLASALVPQGSITVPPLLTPLQITKAFFLAMIMVVVGTLIYDSMVIGHRSIMRLVGHNLGHVMLMIVVAFLLISFRGGILG